MQKDIKRQRSQNWLHEDKIILRDLIKERIHIISNKNTDYNTNKQKEKAWDDVLLNFNNVCKGVTRTLPQVKAQWGIIKMHANKLRAEKRKGQAQSGAGAVFGEACRAEPDDVAVPVWLPIEVKIETDDSDTVEMVTTPDIPGPPSADDVKQHNPSRPFGLKITSVPDSGGIQEPVLGDDSNERWWCTDSNDKKYENGVNTDVSNEAAKRRKVECATMQNKKTTAIPADEAQTPAAQVAATEIECRRELHEMQMKVVNLQVANEEHKSRVLQLEEVLNNTKIEYYRRKMLSNREMQEDSD